MTPSEDSGQKPYITEAGGRWESAHASRKPAGRRRPTTASGPPVADTDAAASGHPAPGGEQQSLLAGVLGETQFLPCHVLPYHAGLTVVLLRLREPLGTRGDELGVEP